MPEGAVESATASLRRLLAQGRYEPGDRLPPERELAENLRVSRPTLREAIRRLTDAGLLEPRRGSGTYVAEVDLDNVFALRLRLEPYGAGLAARHRRTAEMQRLAALVAELGRSLDQPERFAANDLDIHRTVAEASGNPILADILERLGELVALSRAVTSPERAARNAALRDLRKLIRAIRARDEAAATAAMERHLEEMRAIAARWRPRARALEELSEASDVPR